MEMFQYSFFLDKKLINVWEKYNLCNLTISIEYGLQKHNNNRQGEIWWIKIKVEFDLDREQSLVV